MESSEQGRENTPDSQKVPISLEQLYDSISSKLKAEDGKVPEEPIGESYTHLAVDQYGWWFCPFCSIHVPDDKQREDWENFGYRSLSSPIGSLESIYTNARPDQKNSVFFPNPPDTVQCYCRAFVDENQGDVGCGFNREIAEEGRWPNKEQLFKDESKHKFEISFVCTGCSVTNAQLELNDERKKYIERPEMQMSRKISGYVQQRVEWFETKESGDVNGYAKHLIYDGDLESLECGTEYWGQGGGIKESTCQYVYGKRHMYWAPKKSNEWVRHERVDWISGGFSSSESNSSGRASVEKRSSKELE
ncbi:hypothetical protein BS50DRAFT_653995 [Corynespora cassiicola Philippines]|uniref:Uncharacterized protein n=1 Tax=Corynespora cassiicola Philippines TaxID=1448308 RepID=A0A2T2P7A3_CORCC|nr:hypothetical protein BS50DRAFT_653995 [Corynespora cassiicola Philippines]